MVLLTLTGTKILSTYRAKGAWRPDDVLYHINIIVFGDVSWVAGSSVDMSAMYDNDKKPSL